MHDLGMAELHVEAAPPPIPDATRTERVALRALQAGAVLIVLAAVTWREFELDRFFVPKELVLHATALVAGLALLRDVRRLAFTLTDLFLVLFIALSVVSAVLATNGWLAVRALSISASGLVVFWSARVLAQAGLGRQLVHAVALAAAIGVATSLLQTYGVRTDLFSVNRAPGGTLGNRNFVAHMAAFALPVTLLIALRTHSHIRFLAAAAGAAVLAATLVLTRSRAGLLALAVVLVVFAAAMVTAPLLRRSRRTWLRLLLLLGIAGVGVAAAVLIPNELQWRGDNPYLESITSVANYQEGSGRGRLVQYRQSVRMTVAHPLFGVGPGNWSVRYPEYAARRDPSLDRSQAGVTSNPWPSSDWIAFLSERGPLSMTMLGLALLTILLAAVRRLFTGPDDHAALADATMIATILAAVTAGMFDAVLLLALPTLLVWTALGALGPTPSPRSLGMRPALTIAFVGALFITGIGMLRSSAQLTSMGMYASSADARWLARAAVVDPGSYRLHLRLARPASGLSRADRCHHALAARDLMPEAAAARDLARGCTR
jgi:O-antigen ligase